MSKLPNAGRGAIVRRTITALIGVIVLMIVLWRWYSPHADRLDSGSVSANPSKLGVTLVSDVPQSLPPPWHGETVTNGGFVNEHVRDLTYLESSMETYQVPHSEVEQLKIKNILKYNLKRLKDLEQRHDDISEELQGRIETSIAKAEKILSDG